MINNYTAIVILSCLTICVLSILVYENARFEKSMNNNKKEALYKYMFPEYPDVVSINQLRKILGISRHLAYDLVTTQKIYSLRIGNSFKIPKVCVVDYIIENFGNLERNPADETTRT